MKMKWLAGGAFAAALVVGIWALGRQEAPAAYPAGDPQQGGPYGITFKSQAGLHVPSDTAEFIGLALADVLESRDASGTVTIPKSALLQTVEGSFVYTASGDRFVRTAVTPGAVNGEFAKIKDGLFPGDRIVTHPVMALWMAELQTIRGGKACADGH